MPVEHDLEVGGDSGKWGSRFQSQDDALSKWKLERRGL